MKLMIPFLTSAVLCLAVQTHAAGKIVGFERISECVATEPSLIPKITIRYSANPYALPAIGLTALPPEFNTGARASSDRSVTILGLDKKKFFNTSIERLVSINDRTAIEVSVGVEDAEQSQFRATVEVHVTKQTTQTSTAEFDCRLISHRDLTADDLFPKN